MLWLCVELVEEIFLQALSNKYGKIQGIMNKRGFNPELVLSFNPGGRSIRR
jgi:hypothetical protein